MSFCSKKRQELQPVHFNSNICKGFSMTDPKYATMDDINEWAFQKIKIGADWNSELICTWDSHKIALVDYEDYLTYQDEEDKESIKDHIVRYVMTHKCGVRTLSGGEDIDQSYTIYYMPQLWKQALVLYLFSEKMITVPKGKSSFDIFRAILLGYKKDSIFEYINDQSERLAEFLYHNLSHTLRSHETVMVKGQRVNKNLYEMWGECPTGLKKFIYESIYKELYDIEIYEQFEEEYQKINDYIEELFRMLDESSYLKAFARGFDLSLSHPLQKLQNMSGKKVKINKKKAVKKVKKTKKSMKRK